MDTTILLAPNFNASDATQMIKLLTTTDVPLCFKQSLSKSIHSKVGTKAGPQHSKKDTQDLQSLKKGYDFAPKWLWDSLLEKTTPYNRCILGFKQWCRSLGIVHGNEPTWVVLAAMFLLGRATAQGPSNRTLSTSDAVEVLNDLKEYIRPGKKEPKLPHWGQILLYPAKPEELATEWPDIYELAYPEAHAKPENRPMKCPLDMQILEHLILALPKRKSHRLVRLLEKPMGPMRGLCHSASGSLALEDASRMPRLRKSIDECQDEFPCVTHAFFLRTPRMACPLGYNLSRNGKGIFPFDCIFALHPEPDCEAQNSELWHCHGIAMAMPWHCHGMAMAIWHWHGNATAMPWNYHGNAMALPWQCHGIGMAWPWHCHGHSTLGQAGPIANWPGPHILATATIMNS